MSSLQRRSAVSDADARVARNVIATTAAKMDAERPARLIMAFVLARRRPKQNRVAVGRPYSG